MEKVFLGLVWKDDETPLFHIRTQATNEDEYIHIPLRLNLKNLHERFCVGIVNPLTMEYKPCNNRVDENSSQCNNCKFMFEFYKCVRCHGNDCNVHNMISKEYCDSPHWVYMAYFPGNKIKVGTASMQRKESRLLEQGALYGMYIARTPNGKIARQIEQIIASNGVPSMVTTAYKMKNLVYDENSVQIREMLIDKCDEVQNLVPQNYLEYLITPEFKSFPNVLKMISGDHFEKKELKQSKDRYLVETKFDEISGDFLFAVGKILAIRTENGVKLIDTRKMEGFNFEFEEKTDFKLIKVEENEYER